MRTLRMLVVLCALCGVLFLSGCGNVDLRGDALTAAENSTMDAYQALRRAQGEPSEATTQPSWVQSYLVEDFKQWRLFVRIARKDLTWGPKLAGE